MRCARYVGVLVRRGLGGGSEVEEADEQHKEEAERRDSVLSRHCDESGTAQEVTENVLVVEQRSRRSCQRATGSLVSLRRVMDAAA